MPTRKPKRTAFQGVQRLEANHYRVRGEYVCPKTGRRKEFDRRVQARSTEEASALRLAIKHELLDPPKTDARQRLADYATKWLDGKLPTLKASTRDLYASVLDLHILPALGDYFLDAITSQDITRWRNAQQGAPDTINGRLRILKNLLSDAAHEFGWHGSPAERVGCVRQVLSDERTKVMTEAQLRAVLAHVHGHDHGWYPLILTLALTGARFGEVSALCWDDIDFTRLEIVLKRAHWRGKVDTTKTGTRRVVPMAEPLAQVLLQHRQSLFAKQAPGFAAGWVFPSRVGRLSTPSTIRKPLARAAASEAANAVGLIRAPSAHWFRHTMSNLLRLHTTGQVQRSVTGHSTEAMSEHYSHVSLDEKRVAIHAVVTSLGTQPGINPGTSRSRNETAG